MDKEEYKDRIKKQIEVLEGYLEGKGIQVSYGGGIWEDTEHPEWTWDVIKYRVKPDEAEESKKLMTYRQLSELITKGYGQWLYNYDNAVMGKNTLFIDKEVNENILIRPWGLDKLVRPTMDVYEEFMKRKAEEHQGETVKDYSDCGSVEPKLGEVFRYNGLTLRCEEGGCVGCALINSHCYAFKCLEKGRKDGKSVHFVDVSEKENTTASEESSSTVSKEESVGVHRRTPQEIADFFNCYVAMDKDGMWCLYVEEPTIVTVIKDGWRLKNPRRDSFLFINDALLSKPNPIDWRTLYRPHKEPLVMEDEDD